MPAKAKLGATIEYCNANGEKGFEEYARARLKQSADEVRALMRKNPY